MSTNAKSSGKLSRVVSSELVFKGPLFSVFTDQVEEPDNVRARRDVIRHQGSVVVLAVDDSRRVPTVLLERQYRYAADVRMWELPAGHIDAGEETLVAAKRELLEETGFTARRWQKALSFYVSPGFLDERMYVFLARGLEAGDTRMEADERIATRFFSLPQAVGMAMSGKIIDAKTLASIFWLEKKLGRFRQDSQARNIIRQF